MLRWLSPWKASSPLLSGPCTLHLVMNLSALHFNLPDLLLCHSAPLFPRLIFSSNSAHGGETPALKKCVWTPCVIMWDCWLIKLLFIFLPLLSITVSRWAGSMHRWAGDVSSVCYSWWWSWWSATCCAGCRTASWPCWLPSGRRAWSHPRRASSPRSWPRRARLSTQSSTSSWINRWEREGVEDCSWGQCLLSFAVIRWQGKVTVLTEAGHFDCFQGGLIEW